jgi:tetratricopeptide (TPR) repeat protein
MPRPEAADNQGVSPFPWNVPLAQSTAADDLQIRDRAPWDLVLHLARAGRPQEAVAALEGLWAAWGVSPSDCGRALLAGLLAEVAEEERAAGNLERALELIDRALGEVPAAAELRLARARIHLEGGEDAAGQADLLAALESERTHPAAAVELALLEARAGHLGDAVGRLGHLGASHPPADRGRFATGLDRLRGGSWETAAEELRGAYLTGERSLGEGLKRVGRLLEAGEVGRALNEAGEWSDRSPASPEAHCAVGHCCLALGWLDDAAEAFGRALDHSPHDHLARLYLAWVLFQRGEAPVAEGEVLRVLTACPGHELALALWRQRCGSRPTTRPAIVHEAA